MPTIPRILATRTAAQGGRLRRHRWIIYPLCRADSGEDAGNQGAKRTRLTLKKHGRVRHN